MRADAAERWGAFAYSGFRRYWLASVCRVFGLQFRIIGVGWLVGSEEGLGLSPLWLGIVGLATTLPTIALSVPAGIVSDRHEHRWILAGTQVVTALLSLALALLILTDRVDVGVVIVWAVIVGSLTALSTPAQSAILPRLIEREAMASAVALTSTVWNTMRIVGPAAAGVLIAWVGIGQAFLVTSLGFAISAFLLATLRLEPLVREPHADDGGVLEGVRYVLREPVFLGTIGLSFFTSIFGMSYQTLLPVFADGVLHVGSDGFGMLHTAAGVGGFIGTFAMIKLGGGRHAGTVMLASAGVFGLFMAGFAHSTALRVAMALLFCSGFASAIYLNIGMTTLQLRVPDALRGRVMAVWSMTWFLAAIGGLPASALAEWLGAPLAVTFGGLSVSAFALLLFVGAPALRGLDTQTPAAAPRRASESP